jgi:GDP-L-fucose synthase
MWQDLRVLVTGGRGFLGTHVVERLHQLGADPVSVGRAEADLLDLDSTLSLFHSVGAQAVVHCAVNGGGIGWMGSHPVESGRDSARMNLNALEAAHRSGAALFIGVSSACVYPRDGEIPLVESRIWDGYPEPTNGPYALSKRLMMDLGAAYHRQHGLQVAFPILANLYGPGDALSQDRAHAVAGLLLRCLGGPDELVVWGSGNATREFLYVEDAADGVLASARCSRPEPVNIGTGIEVPIARLASEISRACGYTGTLRFDTRKPDGQPRKCMSIGAAAERLGWRSRTSLADGLDRTVAWYRLQLGLEG